MTTTAPLAPAPRTIRVNLADPGAEPFAEIPGEEEHLPPRPVPLADRPAWRRQATGALGALIAITLTGLITLALQSHSPALPWLIAPVGASAVLVFAIPASPLAQPWPVLGGNLIAAAIGLLIHDAGLAPPLAAGLAVGLSCAVMMALRCTHPPAGGTAAMMALASPAMASARWHFLLSPIAVNLVAVVVLGVLWNRLTGHSYPHRITPPSQQPPWPERPRDFNLNDVRAVLEEWNDEIDVSPQDLAALFHAVEARAASRTEAD